MTSSSSCPAGHARSVRRHTRRPGHASLGRRLQPRRPPPAPPAPPWTGQAPRRQCQWLPSKVQVSTSLGLLWVLPERCWGRSDRCLAAHGCVCEQVVLADVGLHTHSQDAVSSCCLPADAGSYLGFLKLQPLPRASPCFASQHKQGQHPAGSAEAGTTKYLLCLWGWRHASQQCCARPGELCPAPYPACYPPSQHTLPTSSRCSSCIWPVRAWHSQDTAHICVHACHGALTMCCRQHSCRRGP